MSLPDTPLPAGSSGFEAYTQERINHWDAVAQKMDTWKSWGRSYANRLQEVYRFQIPPDQDVLEVGCGQGDLLAALQAKNAVGIDFSAEMIARGRIAHPEVVFKHADAHTFDLDGRKFDYIILSDVVNDLYDVAGVLEQVKSHTHPRTRLILNYYSRVWEMPLIIARQLGLAKQNLAQNWLTWTDIDNLLALAGFETIRSWQEVLLPLPIPLLEPLFNRILVRLWPLNYAGLANFTLARPAPPQSSQQKEFRVSVVIPARNEAGNIGKIYRRVPEMGAGTELVFVEGHSRDDTYEAIERVISAGDRNAVLLRQPGIGKADAVREGFRKANGDILMILDADLSVAPERLPGFYNTITQGTGEFINGVRLVYPMEKQAMRFLNFIGNKIFSMIFSWLLGQQIKDTLCGTKVLWRQDYELIAANRAYFGDFDPFGDFDLILGAVKLNRKLVDFPIRYQARTYGETNIKRWRHGWLLVRMVAFAAKRIKFV
ncbi:MAG: glycosyltransferase [Anaerolineales bacterium]|jgi:SAM-dependent methyltransferase